MFGSVLLGEDTEGNDLDILVDPTEEALLVDIGAIRGGLSGLLGVEVDVLIPGVLSDRWRDDMLTRARPL